MGEVVFTSISGTGGSLEIEIHIEHQDALKDGWAKCYLRTETNKMYLGAESASTLLSNMVNQLNNTECGLNGSNIFGQNARLVRSLSERWCGIYVAPNGSARSLYFLDALNEPVHCIGKIEVVEDEWVPWRQQLKMLLEQEP